MRSAVDRLFAAAGVDRAAAFEVNDILTAVDLVRRDLAVSVVPASLAARFDDLEVRHFPEPVPSWSIRVVYHAGKLSPAVAALLEQLP